MDRTRDLASLAGEETIFGGFAAEKLQRLQAELEPLSWRYDVVVANPPYMGSKNMNKWLGDWIKTHYKDVKGDLFSCFMVRNVGMGAEHTQLGFMTPYVWMFIGTYEKLRKFVIQQNAITLLIQLEYSGFSGATVPICTFTVQKGYCPGYRGGYVRLSDFVRADQQAPRALEALANPECGWFYRADASGFEAIPGSPISYWATQAMRRAFENGTPLGKIAEPKQGMVTRDNSKFMRLWWEVDHARTSTNLRTHEEARSDKSYKWIPCTSGGAYRKWYGNNESVVNWANDGEELIAFSGPHIKNREYYFRESVTWTAISSSVLSTRYAPTGFVPEHAGNCLYGSNLDLKLLQGVCNSSFCLKVMSILSPTLNFNVGDLVKIPIVSDNERLYDVVNLVEECRNLSKSDWDFFELSWEFNQHPLV